MKVQVALVLISLTAVCSSTSVPGAPWVIYPSIVDPIVTQAVTFINEYFRSLGDYTPRQALRVLRATEQIVSGNLYVFDLNVVGGPRIEQCHVEYVNQSWLPVPNSLIKSVTCGEYNPATTYKPVF
ncbi:unnamed protein product [Candidula unifasciata]|uniref:Cystatin domain-containing protein n=1 Tax=Candidula unifasciata TaxID=100452 RepID=A0A8S3YSP5_9EUPU|nr:unnamed protein product [Candidula unifasciata]